MERTRYFEEIKGASKHFPVIAMIGPRQVGKTTLAREFFSKMSSPPQNYFDLEDPEDLRRLQDPKLALSSLTGLVVIDEIQRFKELFPLIRVLVDRDKNDTKFLVLGSASKELLAQTSESLAGRIKYIQVYPFSFAEKLSLQFDKLWIRGGFPRSYLAKSDEGAFDWIEQFMRTFLERDIINLGFNYPAESMRRFWLMIAHYHGQIFKASELGRSLDLSDSTMKRYLDLLVGTFMVRRLSPWFENISKRQIKLPKIYISDSGMFHHLLGIKNLNELTVHPKLGASWEGFVLDEIIKAHHAREEETFFWGVHNQFDLDLLIVKDGSKYGFEIKHTSTPTVTPKLKEIYELLNLDSLTLVHAGDKSYDYDKKISVVSFKKLVESFH